MPQLVEVPDHGMVEFPDHMDDAAIAGAIKSQSAPSDLSKYISLPGRDSAEGQPLGGKVAEDKGFLNDLKQFSSANLLDETGISTLKPTDAEAGAILRTISPMTNLLPADKVDEIAGATADTLEGVAAFPTSALGAAAGALAATGGTAAALVGGGFAVDSLTDIPARLKAVHQATDARSMTSALEALGLNAAMVAAPFLHAVNKLSEAPKTEPPTPTVPETPKDVTTVTTTGGEPTPQQEAQRMLANMQPRQEQPIIGTGAQPLTPSVVETPLPSDLVQPPAGSIAHSTVTSGTQSAKLAKAYQRAGFKPVGDVPEGGVPEKMRWEPSEKPTTMKMTSSQSGALNVDVLKDALKEYMEGWKSRAAGAGRLASAAGRFAATREQRDRIPALYDAAETKAGYVANQARNSVKLEAESPLARKAATFVQQSAGDRVGMEAKLDAIRGKGYDDVIDYAKAHWDDLEKVAAKAQEQTDAAHQAALASGMDLAYREGYVKGAYEQYEPQNRKVVFGETKGGGGVGTSFRNEKVYNDYAEAIAAGEKPSTLDLADLTQSAVLSSMRAVNRRNWVDALSAITMPDGKPVTIAPETVPRRDSSGAVASPGLQAPEGYRLQDIGGGMTAVHEDVAPLVDALVSPSKFPKWMAQLAGGVKHNILAFDIYHGSRFGQMQMAMMRQKTPSFRKGLTVMEYSDADLSKAVKSGEVTKEQADYARVNRPIIEAGIEAGANIGRISDALYKDVAPLLPFAKATTKFIFDKLSRGIIAESYVYAFKRNQGLHPTMGEAALHRMTAKEINTYYRNLGNQGVLKSKTFQDISRFMLLAPQWFEGRVRSEAVGAGQLAKSAVTLKKPGNVGAAMGTGLVAYFAINQLINMATRGQPTWENPEPGHKMDAWVPDAIGNSSGNFISPLSVFAETTHDVQKLHERGTSMLDVAGNIAAGQVGPVPRTVWDVATGRDFYGQKLHGLDRFTQAAKDIAPVPLSLKSQGTAGSGERQAMSFAGIKSVGAGTASTNTYKLADAWMNRHDIKRPGAQEGETGPPSIYRPLRQALEVGDFKKARQELAELRKTTGEDLIDRHFAGMDNVRFTGRKSTEDDFIASLKPKEKQLYDRAILERQRVMDRYDRIK